MSEIANNITELIGNTPLVRINKLTCGLKVEILAKLESFNPLSSIKDRTALSMIEDAKAKNLINKETVIIEATSGNTGIGLAFICASRGYKLILTMPETMSIERRKLLKVFGAEVVLTPADKGMPAAVEKAEELAKKYKNSLILGQFENPANPKIHEVTTANEILKDTEGKVDILVAGVGTGGTLTGIARRLKKKNQKVKIVAVEPLASSVLLGKEPHPHKIQGIGAGFIPKVLERGLIDRIIAVTDNEAKDTSLRLAKEEGILAGISSGAALFAALKIAKEKENEGKRIIVIFADTGERYISSWLFEDL